MVSAPKSFLANRLSAGKVIVVEPDPDILRMLEVRLAREGHEILLADTAKAALEVSRGMDIDAVLVERNLQDMSAFELLTQLKKEHKTMEAILTTIDASAEAGVNALENGFFDVLTKPFSNLRIVTQKVKNAVTQVRAIKDREELVRLLTQQTKDLDTNPSEVRTDSNMEIQVSGIDFDEISGTDSLTGLPSRKAFEERYRAETQRALRYDRSLSIVRASVDDLDTVIARFGVKVGDGVLRGVASLFSGKIRGSDLVARLQGGEFIFLFPETPKEHCQVVIHRIHAALKDTKFSEVDESEQTGFRLRACFGIASLPKDTLDATFLREASELALAKAQSAKDRVVIYERELGGNSSS